MRSCGARPSNLRSLWQVGVERLFFQLAGALLSVAKPPGHGPGPVQRAVGQRLGPCTPPAPGADTPCHRRPEDSLGSRREPRIRRAQADYRWARPLLRWVLAGWRTRPSPQHAEIGERIFSQRALPHFRVVRSLTAAVALSYVRVGFCNNRCICGQGRSNPKETTTVLNTVLLTQSPVPSAIPEARTLPRADPEPSDGQVRRQPAQALQVNGQGRRRSILALWLSCPPHSPLLHAAPFTGCPTLFSCCLITSPVPFTVAKIVTRSRSRGLTNLCLVYSASILSAASCVPATTLLERSLPDPPRITLSATP